MGVTYRMWAVFHEGEPVELFKDRESAEYKAGSWAGYSVKEVTVRVE